jgi:hypothetical protein
MLLNFSVSKGKMPITTTSAGEIILEHHDIAIEVVGALVAAVAGFLDCWSFPGGEDGGSVGTAGLSRRRAGHRRNHAGRQVRRGRAGRP